MRGQRPVRLICLSTPSGGQSSIGQTRSPPASHVPLAARAIIFPVPAPTNERQSLEHELREELPAQLAAYQKELDATPVTFKERRERIEWQIRRVEKRMAELEARLAMLGELTGWTICAPHEHASQTCPLSRPPSSSPQCWCSRTKATKAARIAGMGPGDYHKR